MRPEVTSRWRQSVRVKAAGTVTTEFRICLRKDTVAWNDQRNTKKKEIRNAQVRPGKGRTNPRESSDKKNGRRMRACTDAVRKRFQLRRRRVLIYARVLIKLQLHAIEPRYGSTGGKRIPESTTEEDETTEGSCSLFGRRDRNGNDIRRTEIITRGSPSIANPRRNLQSVDLGAAGRGLLNKWT